MSWREPEEGPWEDPGEDPADSSSPRWPLDWRGLYPRERWLWFEQLWCDVCGLRERYGLSIRSRWWEHQMQVEALAALAAWASRYDSGEWDDPPGKLALLYDLERVATLLRDGVPRARRPAMPTPQKRLALELPTDELPAQGIGLDTAHQLISSELLLDGQSRLNLATFVTTWMPSQGVRVMAETADKNMIDK